MKYLIGLDIGTSSVKGVLMSEKKDIIKSITKQHEYYFENALKLLDADLFCDSCIDVIRELSYGVNSDIIALCASGASGNLMLKGRENSPIYSWQNEFDDKIIDRYLENYSASDIYKIIGWPKLNSFPLSVLCYLKDTNPDLIKSADNVCMSIEYLNYRLTGRWGITVSMGTPFYLINQEKRKYHKDFLEIFGITEDKLPPIMDNYSVLGTLTKEASEKTGLSADTKVVLGTFDHPSAARGAGVFTTDEVLLSCGTSWVSLIPFKERKAPFGKELLIDPFMSPDGMWCGMKSLPSISESIDRCKEKYFDSISYEEFDELVSKSYLGANGVIVDIDNPSELPANTEKCHIARAIAEGAARKLCEMLDELEISVTKLKIVGGITKSREWLKVISEVCQKEIEVVNGECAGAAGAALMAGVGTKVFDIERV